MGRKQQQWQRLQSPIVALFSSAWSTSVPGFQVQLERSALRCLDVCQAQRVISVS